MAAASEPGPFEQKHITPAIFFAPYRAALGSLESPAYDIAQLGMFQLGLPTKTSLVLWYSLPEASAPEDRVSLALIGPTGAAIPVPEGSLRGVHNRTHRTGRIEIVGLAPGTTHKFQLTAPRLTAPLVVEGSTIPAEPGSFSFIGASCFLPWNYGSADQTYIANETVALLRTLDARAHSMRKRGTGPSFYMGLGDQIYVDPGADEEPAIAYLYGKHSEKMRGSLATTPEVLRGLYRYHLGLRPMNSTLSKLPSVMMWDDHDIRDGWGSQNDEDAPGWATYYKAAREAFTAFQASRNPHFQPGPLDGDWEKTGAAEPALPSVSLPRAPGEQHFTFSWGAGEFFVVDGKTSRNFRERRGMSLEQIGAVGSWLTNLARRKDESLVYVFCFPVPLSGGAAVLPAWSATKTRDDSDDARDRPWILSEERDLLLNALLTHARNHPKHRLIILSGDVHYSGIQVLREDSEIRGYEIISSGLAQTKFNDKGPFWATVGRSIGPVAVTDHGYYAGPSFAEIFINPVAKDGPPEVKVLFYPAAERKATWSRLDNYSTLFLNVENVDQSFAQTPESYPENTPKFSLFGRTVTRSHLAEHIILDRWLGSGRATRGPIPWEPAKSW